MSRARLCTVRAEQLQLLCRKDSFRHLGCEPASLIAESEFVEVTAEYLGEKKFVVSARAHRLICDQPLDNGGEDLGFAPPEFLLASLASCAAYYAVEYLKTRSIAVPELKVRVTAEKAKQPARLGSFQIEVSAPGLEARQEAGILRAVQACLIHNTLRNPPAIAVVVNADHLAPAI